MREFAVGDLIAGRYRIEATLGRGGMGVVYTARDTRLNREVAVKTISAKVLAATNSHSEDPIVQFETEALATAKLENPHVVTIYDAGSHRDARTQEGIQIPFLIMERLHGRDLECTMAEQRGRALEQERAVHIMLEVCFAIAGAHAFQIFHRDLSSKNVFVTRHVTKVLDFGLARLRDEPRNTEKGFVRGTQQYMAPERFRGEDAGNLGDVYSIGVLLYETLTGTVPFFNETTRKPLTGDSLVPAILGGHCSLPRERNPDLSEELERVILRAMAVRARERFQSVHLLARELLPFARGAGRMLTEHFSGPEPVVQRIEMLTGRSSGGTGERDEPEDNRVVVPAALGTKFVVAREGEPLQVEDELVNSLLMEDFSTVEARYDADTARAARKSTGRPVSPLVRESETSSERRWVQVSEFRTTTSEREGPRSRLRATVGWALVLSVVTVAVIVAASKKTGQPETLPADPSAAAQFRAQEPMQPAAVPSKPVPAAELPRPAEAEALVPAVNERSAGPAKENGPRAEGVRSTKKTTSPKARPDGGERVAKRPVSATVKEKVTRTQTRPETPHQIRKRRSAPRVVMIMATSRAMIVIGLVLLLLPRAVRAGPAVELLMQAIEKRRQGLERKNPARLEEALELFREAHEKERSGRTMGHIGLCEQLLERWEESEEHLVQALSDYPADPWIEAHQVELNKALKVIRGHFGELVVTGRPAGAEVWVNRRMRGTLPLEGPLRVGEGTVHLQVTARGGYVPFLANPPPLVRAGGRTAVSVNMEKVRYTEIDVAGPPSSVAPAPKGVAQASRDDVSEQAAGWSGRQIGALVAGGLGVVAAVTGIVWVVQARRWCAQAAAARRACNDPTGEERPGWMVLGAGTAAGGAGAALWIVGKRLQVASTGGAFRVALEGRF